MIDNKISKYYVPVLQLAACFLLTIFCKESIAGVNNVLQTKQDSIPSGMRLSTFDIDATPPVGAHLAYDTEVNKWDLGLRAKGVVLLAPENQL